MAKPSVQSGFQTLNRGYNAVFQAHRLSVGLVVPLEHYANTAVPTMLEQTRHIRLAEELVRCQPNNDEFSVARGVSQQGTSCGE